MKKSIYIRILLSIDVALAIALVCGSITKIFLLDAFTTKLFLIVSLSSFGVSVILSYLILLYLSHKRMIEIKQEIDYIS